MKVKVNTASVECEGTDEIVCPYCRGVQSNSWEFGNELEYTSEIECGHCSREFIATREITVEYHSRPKTISPGRYIEWHEGDIFDDELNESDEEWANKYGMLPCEVVEEDKG